MLTFNPSYDGGTFEEITVEQLNTMYARARGLQLTYKALDDTKNWMRYTAICIRICIMINNKITF